MLILAIFAYHFWNIYPTKVAPDIGFLMVGAFFMFSGFGLLESFKNKENYLDRFVEKKTARLLVPLWIAGVVVLIIELTVYNNHSVLNEQVYLFDIISGGLTTTRTWFVVELIFFYMLFYLGFKFLSVRWAIIAISLAVALLMALLSLQKGGMWYVSGIMFPMGLVISYYKDRIEKTRPMTILIISTCASLIFACLITLPRYAAVDNLLYGNLQCVLIGIIVISSLLMRKYGIVKWILVLLLCNIVFYSFEHTMDLGPSITLALPAISVFLTLSGITDLSLFTDFVGEISYELYLIHEVIIWASKELFSDMIQCLIFSFVISIILAVVIKKISGIFFDDGKKTTEPR